MPTGLPDALVALARFAVGLRLTDLPDDVRARVSLVLLDHLGVTAAGATTDEGQRLVAACEPPPGPAPVVGAGCATTVDLAAWLNGTAACSLELDEGNKYARGHPAAHAFPAALALAASRHVGGADLLVALLVGYEVAARFGAATTLHRGVHPHGNWGATGAAAASALLLGLPAESVAGALDAATGLVLATPFETALEGNLVRNTWVGAANVAGLSAARLAAAGLATADATAASTLGTLLGTFDPSVLVDGLGERWFITAGYFKRHASCSYTHPPADAVLALRAAHPDLGGDDVVAVTVETHHLAAGLRRPEPATRLGAMFSIPHVVAAALVSGDCSPARFDDAHRADERIRRLAAATTVVRSDAFDARLPAERAARVTVALRDGRTVSAEVPNPVGDVDHRPFALPEVRAKLAALLADAPLAGADVEKVVDDLPDAADVAPVLARLA